MRRCETSQSIHVTDLPDDARERTASRKVCRSLRVIVRHSRRVRGPQLELPVPSLVLLLLVLLSLLVVLPPVLLVELVVASLTLLLAVLLLSSPPPPTLTLVLVEVASPLPPSHSWLLHDLLSAEDVTRHRRVST